MYVCVCVNVGCWFYFCVHARIKFCNIGCRTRANVPFRYFHFIFSRRRIFFSLSLTLSLSLSLSLAHSLIRSFASFVCSFICSFSSVQFSSTQWHFVWHGVLLNRGFCCRNTITISAHPIPFYTINICIHVKMCALLHLFTCSSLSHALARSHTLSLHR